MVMVIIVSKNFPAGNSSLDNGYVKLTHITSDITVPKSVLTTVFLKHCHIYPDDTTTSHAFQSGCCGKSLNSSVSSAFGVILCVNTFQNGIKTDIQNIVTIE